MLQALLLRFLPRRLLPLLALYQGYRLFRAFRASRSARRPARLVVSKSPRRPVTSMTPDPVDGQVYGG